LRLLSRPRRAEGPGARALRDLWRHVTVSEDLAAPGFLSDVHASGYLVAKLTPAPEELGLARHGLELITPDPNWAQVFPDGRAFTIGRDVEETARSMAQFSRADADAWRGLYQRYLAAKPEIVAGMTSTPPPLAKEFAGHDAVDSYRFQFQSARAWVEGTFQSPEMRYFFASCALHGALAPDDALGANFAWLFAAAVQDVGVSIVKGGMHNVSRALAAELAAHGGEIRVNAGVKSIVVEKGSATSVRLENGEVIALDGVLASNVDPRHLALDLLGEAQIGRASPARSSATIGDSPSSGSTSRSTHPCLIAPAPRRTRPATSISAVLRSTISPRPSRKRAPGSCRAGR
jgi:phytoene dehydrogenase-like protein